MITDDQRIYSGPDSARMMKNNTISRDPLWSRDRTNGLILSPTAWNTVMMTNRSG